MTNGVISLTRNGVVAFKIVAGCDGYNADKVIAAVHKTEKELNAGVLHNLARHEGFGCSDCLVVVSPEEIYFMGDEEIMGDSLYRTKFDDAKFNPRWERGTADYVRVVELQSGSQSPK